MKIVCEASDKEFRIFSAEWEFLKETPRYYVIRSSESVTKNLIKNKLNHISTTIKSEKHIGFHSYCESDNEAQISKQMIEMVYATIKKRKEYLIQLEHQVIKHVSSLKNNPT